MGGVGPMFGQWNHFGAYAPEKIPYAIERYTNEVEAADPGAEPAARRDALARRRRIQHGRHHHLPVAAHRSRIAAVRRARYIDLAEYPHVKRWYDEIAARPAVQRGLAVLAELREQETITEAEREVYFGKTQFTAR